MVFMVFAVKLARAFGIIVDAFVKDVDEFTFWSADTAMVGA